jgi:hypothetical protein
MNLELDLKRSFLDPKKRHLSINDTTLTYDGKTFLLKEITDIKYGSLTITTYGIKANKIYEFQFRRHGGDKIRITFSAAGLVKFGKEKEEIYSQIHNAIWPIIKRLTNQYLANIHRGESVIIKNLEIKKDGIVITKRPLLNLFRKKAFHIPWNKVQSSAYNGNYILRSIDKKRIYVSLNCLRDWNTNVINFLIDYLFEGGRCFKLGEKKFEII